MIEELRLRGLGVIAEADLPLGPGFTAITGETGAGKTMVVTALGLLLGARSDSGVVRVGDDSAVVEGTWIVPDEGGVATRVRDAGGDLELLADERAELYISRTVSSTGRSRATVGGRTVPAGVLVELADRLVVVHGQSDQLRLRSATAQRDALDRFGGTPIAAAHDRYRELFDRHRAVAAMLEEITTRGSERAAEAALLREELERIEAVDPQPGEDVALARRAERLANAEALRAAAIDAHTTLSSDDDAPDVYTLLAHARRTLERDAGDDPDLAAVAEALTDLEYRAADAAATLAGYLADLDETAPQELEQVEERRAALAELVRRHGSIDAALQRAADGALLLAELDDDPERRERLAAEAAELESALDSAAEDLTRARTDAAGRLAAAVTVELHELALPDATVSVQVAPTTPSGAGRDEVTILLAPHPGAEPRPVARSASGGELSRVMLALEVVMAETNPIPTFVFDEVDAGIGGAAAIEVGRRLAQLAASSQVIVVTHLAQVAAFASNHLTVVKSSDGTVTASDVRRLTGEEREAETARLLSGMPDSDAALEHARELLAKGAAR